MILQDLIPSPKFIAKLLKRLKNNHAVVPIIKATDATKT